MSALTLFDYADLSTEDQVETRAAAERIRTRMRRTAEDIVEIGRDLIAVKDRIGHGNFGRWLEGEFEMDERQARRFMGVASRFAAKTDKLSVFTPSVLYELAAPSTPDEVVAKMEAKAEAGEKVSLEEVKVLKRAAAEAEKARDEAEKRAADIAQQNDLLKGSLELHKRTVAEEIEARFAADVAASKSAAEKASAAAESAKKRLVAAEEEGRRAVVEARREVERAAAEQADAAAKAAVAKRQSDLDRIAKAEQAKKDAIARLEHRERELQGLIDQHNEWRAKNGAKDVEEKHLQALIDGAVPTLADLLMEIESRSHDHDGRLVAMAQTVAGYCDKLAEALRGMAQRRVIDLDAA